MSQREDEPDQDLDLKVDQAVRKHVNTILGTPELLNNVNILLQRALSVSASEEDTKEFRKGVESLQALQQGIRGRIRETSKAAFR